jgi:hypothetical protein
MSTSQLPALASASRSSDREDLQVVVWVAREARKKQFGVFKNVPRF